MLVLHRDLRSICAMPHVCVLGGVYTLRFFVFDILDGLLKRCHERHRVNQVALSQLEFGNQHTIFVDHDQTVPLFHVHSSCWFQCDVSSSNYASARLFSTVMRMRSFIQREITSAMTLEARTRPDRILGCCFGKQLPVHLCIVLVCRVLQEGRSVRPACVDGPAWLDFPFPGSYNSSIRTWQPADLA